MRQPMTLSYYRGGRTVGSTRRRALRIAIRLTWNDLLRRPWSHGH